ncbi:MAG: hypothetical protein P8L20_01910 [Flavobacteriales bacterium]|nr:hypothetical protein [Flavobacteriales bacterium]
MSLGEIIALTFIIIVFSAMIFIGIRLFRWNKRDMDAKKAKNDTNKINR